MSFKNTTIDFPYQHRGETVRIRASGYYDVGNWGRPPEGECVLEYVFVPSLPPKCPVLQPGGETLRIDFDKWEKDEALGELEREFIYDEFFRRLRED